MNTPENNLITVFTSKEVSALYKTFLELVEDLRTDHKIMLDKVALKEGKEYADSIDYFTLAKYEQLRKRVLDQGNESSRRLINFLSFFDFVINKQKVEEEAKQKRVTTTKKVITTSAISVE